MSIDRRRAGAVASRGDASDHRQRHDHRLRHSPSGAGPASGLHGATTSGVDLIRLVAGRRLSSSTCPAPMIAADPSWDPRARHPDRRHGDALARSPTARRRHLPPARLLGRAMTAPCASRRLGRSGVRTLVVAGCGPTRRPPDQRGAPHARPRPDRTGGSGVGARAPRPTRRPPNPGDGVDCCRPSSTTCSPSRCGPRPHPAHRSLLPFNGGETLSIRPGPSGRLARPYRRGWPTAGGARRRAWLMGQAIRGVRRGPRRLLS